LNELRNPISYQERFLVNAGQKIKTIKSTEIAYFYIQQKGVYLCTNDAKTYDLNYTLDKLEEILDPKIFFRVNRQFIVNVESIDNLYIVSKSRYKLDIKPKPPEDIIVSVNHLQEFRNWLNK
jgi:DNA-binding LytR/AlgR family response regulator